MSYHHFTTFERARIQELLSMGYSHRKITQKLHRNRSSIDRVIQQNLSGVDYIAEAAQSLYHARRKHAKPKEKHTDDLANIIAAKLEATWSPKQIANTVMLGIVSFKIIYYWLYSGLLPAIVAQNLRHKSKRKGLKCGGNPSWERQFLNAQRMSKTEIPLVTENLIACFPVEEKVGLLCHLFRAKKPTLYCIQHRHHRPR